MTSLNKTLVLSGALALLFAFSASQAQAGGGHGYGGGRYVGTGHGYSSYAGFGYGGYGGYNGPVYHAPSVHLDSVYHPEYSHWTPGRGFHTHGHYDLVPHYTPGHFDYQHGNHVHTNPWFHH